MAKTDVFLLTNSSCLSLSFLCLPSYLVDCSTCWQELLGERFLQQQTAVMPHQTSSKPCGPWWRHSWVDGHDHSLTDRINPPPPTASVFAVLLLISVSWPLSVFPLQLVSIPQCSCTCHSGVKSRQSRQYPKFLRPLFTEQAFTVLRDFVCKDITVL